MAVLTYSYAPISLPAAPVIGVYPMEALRTVKDITFTYMSNTMDPSSITTALVPSKKIFVQNAARLILRTQETSGQGENLIENVVQYWG